MFRDRLAQAATLIHSLKCGRCQELEDAEQALC